LSLLTRQTPIESQFINSIADNLNAEVCLGTVATIEEGAKWLSYTYLQVRMRFNPMIYGVTYRTLEYDPTLMQHRMDLIQIAARNLDKAKMIRYDEKTGYLHATDLGRTASHYYIKYDTIEIINEKLKLDLNEKDIFTLISNSTEFQQLKVRDEEMQEMDQLYSDCPLPIASGIENTTGKVNLLIQSFISRYRLDGFSLVSDMAYVSQNVGRIARALFEIVLKRGWPLMSGRLLNVCKTIEKRLWHFQSPMRQFEMQLQFDILNKIEDKKLSLDKLRELDAKDLGFLLHNQKMGEKIKECVANVPFLEIETSIHPITRSVLRVKLTLTSNFKWNDKMHGTAESFWIWIEDPSNNHIYHHEYFTLQRKHAKTREPQLLVFTIPIFDPLPSQYIVRVISDRWMGVEMSHAITFQHLILPDKHPPHTELLDLDPLPVEALNNPDLQALYSFTHFNPIQTQIFHCLYHTDTNCLIGAPTGSGKTVTAEIAMFRIFNVCPQKKCVYIAPLKALVRERMIDWKLRLETKLNKKVVELTGDVAPDMKMVAEADVIVTTPEKWDGISRSWQTRNYVKEVALIVIDEIHLLGEDRGPVLEVIVSRTNFISSHTNLPVRIIGLSTAIANARDLADWLGIKNLGLYNFKPSVRPVPLEVHIQGFAGKHYCPRMATMNKPCFQEIRLHSPEKPVLIFVSSRRQTRVTAIDLISYLAHEPNPKQWLHMHEIEINNLISQIVDQNLKLTLAFGIGIHHAGLNDRDRKTVEELFVNQKIQILIATSTLAWGVNFPAHLVIVKGTEFYDGKTKRYVDFPITDVLQMMGRAGRPQYDDQGVAVIMVHDVKKHFYKKFLYEPFPVESSLLSVLPDHLNAEIVAGTITSKQEAMDYLTWTYFFRRLIVNPTYYQLEELDNDRINRYLSKLIQQSITTLQGSYCVNVDEDGKLEPTTSGRIASFYYLTHTTLKLFYDTLKENLEIEDLIDILSLASEYDQLPVRHNEDSINADLSTEVPIKVNQYTLDSPHTKCNLLLQAHYSRLKMPCSDYITDLKTVMDQCLRILQAMLDFSADSGLLKTSLSIINLMQMTCQGRWLTDSDLLCLPHIGTEHLARFYGNNPRIDCLPVLMDQLEKKRNSLGDLVGDLLNPTQINEIGQVVAKLPQIEMAFTLAGEFPNGEAKVQLQHNRKQTVYADQDYTLNIELNRLNRPSAKDSKAYAPSFAKPKDENWVAILAECEQNELLALKRIGCVKSKQNANLLFGTQKEGRQTLTLFFMSDVYIGLDQQYEFCFDAIAKD
jgi:activating signal cointegrator complex subunit 3